MTLEQQMHDATQIAFSKLMDAISAEAWDELPQHVKDSATDALDAARAYDLDMRNLVKSWSAR